MQGKSKSEGDVMSAIIIKDPRKDLIDMNEENMLNSRIVILDVLTSTGYRYFAIAHKIAENKFGWQGGIFNVEIEMGPSMGLWFISGNSIMDIIMKAHDQYKNRQDYPEVNVYILENWGQIKKMLDGTLGDNQ